MGKCSAPPSPRMSCKRQLRTYAHTYTYTHIRSILSIPSHPIPSVQVHIHHGIHISHPHYTYVRAFVLASIPYNSNTTLVLPPHIWHRPWRGTLPCYARINTFHVCGLQELSLRMTRMPCASPSRLVKILGIQASATPPRLHRGLILPRAPP